MRKDLGWSKDSEISLERIKKLENRWKIKFPQDYVEIVQYNDEAQAEVINEKGEKVNSGIDIPGWNGRRTNIALLSFKDGYDGFETCSMIDAYNAFLDCIPDPKKMFPFAQNGGGDILFFDYRKNEKEPSIVLLDHENCVVEEYVCEDDLLEKPLSEWQDESLYFVANSFSEFLDKITANKY